MKCTIILLGFLFLGSLHVSKKSLLCESFALLLPQHLKEEFSLVQNDWLCAIFLPVLIFGKHALGSFMLHCESFVGWGSSIRWYWFNKAHDEMTLNMISRQKLYNFPSFLFCWKENTRNEDRWSHRRDDQNGKKKSWCLISIIPWVTCSHQMICLLVLLMISDADSD